MTVKPGHYLVRMINGVEQQYFELKDGLTKIGRANTQDIRCSSLQVSREHCIIDLVGGHVLIRDLQSFNGTYVKNDKIPSLRTCALNEGDLIGLGADSDGPITEFVFKLVIIKDNNNGVANLPMSETEAMLKSLKRKDANDSSTVRTAKKPRNSEVDCIINTKKHSKDLCKGIDYKKQNGEVLPKTIDIISINLESDSESDEPNIRISSKVPAERAECDIEMKQVGSSHEITDKNLEKMQSPIVPTLNKCPSEEENAEQPSFSLNDEVIIISDNDEDEQSSQLFSQHVESTSLMVLNDQLKLKNEVTENYEIRVNEYDDEDRPIENSNIGMFEDHFIQCSQEISLRESAKSLETNSSTLQPPDQVSFMSKANENQIDEDMGNNDIPSSSSSDISTSDLKKIKTAVDCDKMLAKENQCASLISTIQTDNGEENLSSRKKSQPKKNLKEKGTPLSKESKLPLKKSDSEAKKPDKVKQNKIKSKEKENKSIIHHEKIDKPAKCDNKSSDGVLDLKLSAELVKIKPLDKSVLSAKINSDKLVPKKRRSKRNEKEKAPPYRRSSDIEKLRKERGEKLKMIALKAREKAKSKQEEKKQSVEKLESFLVNTQALEPVNISEQEATKPVLNDTVNLSDRSNSLSVSLEKKSAEIMRSKLKDVNQKIDSKKSDDKVVKSVEDGANTLQDHLAVNHINEPLNKHSLSKKHECHEERISRLKLWEQKVIMNFNKSSLNLSTHEGTPNKRKPIVQFKDDLVEIRTFVCEGKFTRKVSDKENRTRREIPAHMPLMEYSWRVSLKTNSVLYDICKWNVTWLEECKKIEGDPPVVRMPYLSIKDSYISHTDYWMTMYPLLMSELWCEVYHDLALQDKSYLPIRTFTGVVRSVIKNPVCTGIDNSTDGRRIVSVDCVFVGYREECRRGLAPVEGDLGIMQVDIPGENKKRFKTFTFASSEMKSVPYHHSNDHFAKFVVTNMKRNGNGEPDKTYSKFEPTTCLYGQLSFCDSPNKPVTEGSLLKLRILRNLYKNLRIFDSLSQLPKSPLANQILNPKCIVRPKSQRKIPKQVVSNFPLNKSQIDIILEISKDLLSGKPSISLIHGPPGTGKTRVIANLVLQIYSHISSKKKNSKMPLKDKILLCAPSNAAIDSLVLRLLEIRQSLPSDKRFKLIRIGPPETIHRHVREIASQTLAAKEVGNTLDAENIKIDLRLLAAEETSLSYAIECARNENARKRFTIELATIQEKKRNLECLMRDQGGGNQSNQARAKMIREAETKVIQGAEIIATTLSSCYARKLIESMSEVQHLKFSYCIVDEATQGIEPEVLLPLLHNITGIVLVGDPLQLAPTILSESGKKYNLGRSVFHRIWREWESDGNIVDRPFFALNIQHRMHPEIAVFPNEEFYNGKLITPDFLNVQLPFLPYCVLSHCYKQNPDGESNTKESELVVKLLNDLNKAAEFKGLTIGVIVPYQRQKQILEKKISSLCEEIKFTKINTVDSYQGQEKDVIIFSCVRTEGIGFLSDRLRVNVALTRARKCLIVVANFSSLQADRTWKSLCHNAKQRGLFQELPSSPGNIVDLLKPHDKRNKSC